MNAHDHSSDTRLVRLFRNGRSQAVRIPKEWEFAGKEVELRQLASGKLMLTAAKTKGLLDYLQTAEPWRGGDFLEGDEGLLPLDEIEFR